MGQPDDFLLEEYLMWAREDSTQREKNLTDLCSSTESGTPSEATSQ